MRGVLGCACADARVAALASRGPKKNPAGGAPRRGDCGPYAEGRVHLRSGQLAWSWHQRPRPVGSIRDSGTRNLRRVL